MRTAKYPERADRLRLFLNQLKVKNVELAKRMGLKRSTYVLQLLNKNTTITAEAANRIAEAYPVLNTRWLLNGTGEMKVQQMALPDKLSEPDVLYSSDPLNGLRAILEKHEQRIAALEAAMEHKDDLLRNLMDRMGRLLQEGGGGNDET